MPTFRPDIESLPAYVAGKPIDELAREIGISEIVKLASNESPLPPFPEVQETMARELSRLNRYPDPSNHGLIGAIADHMQVTPSHVWPAAGTVETLMTVAQAAGGPGTSAVFADPSFMIYPLITRLAHATPIKVPLGDDGAHDFAAMLEAIRPDTTLVYVCNPNNPTGTHTPAAAVEAFIEEIPDRVLIVVDEAYFEYADAPDYATALTMALDRPNVIVTRTFSKVYGLAGLRVGYALGHPTTLGVLRRAQGPMTINTIGQVAAVEALRHQDRVLERVDANAKGRHFLHAELARRGLRPNPTQTNFVLCFPGDPMGVTAELQRQGVIVRPLAGGVRVSVGSDDHMSRLLAALDERTP